MSWMEHLGIWKAAANEGGSDSEVSVDIKKLVFNSETSEPDVVPLNNQFYAKIITEIKQLE